VPQTRPTGDISRLLIRPGFDGDSYSSICSTVREAQGIAPFRFVSLLMFFPNSPVWVVFSIVPFSVPVLMMLRLGLSAVPTWQLVASVVVLVTSVASGLWVAAKLLRICLSMYGKRPRLREIVRAIRARNGKRFVPAKP